MAAELFTKEFMETFLTMNSMGLPFAKTTVLYGASYSFGKNIIRVALMKSKKSVAISDFIRDVIIWFGFGYLAGGIGIGRILSNTVDEQVMSILRSISGDSIEWVRFATNVINGLTYQLAPSFSPVTNVVTSTPIFIIGLSFGLISGLLSKK